MRNYPRPDLLVETDWLFDNLLRSDLRVFECGARPSPNPDKALAKKYPLRPQSGRPLYHEAHIPGANFIDLPTDLTDQTSEIPMMMPPIEQLVEVMQASGIEDGTTVVLYSSTSPMWATRIWWMLRSVGFENAKILNGGIRKWRAEGRPISTESPKYARAKFTPKPHDGVFVIKEDVIAALSDPDTVLLHALTESVFDGTDDTRVFGRRGHIPDSVNVPSDSLHDPDTGTYLSPEKLAQLFAEKFDTSAARIITYCGGGINATNNAFALALLGHENVAIYDGSMNEWGNDHSLPIER